MANWTRDQKIAVLALSVSIVACIAALLVIPEIRDLLGLDNQTDTQVGVIVKPTSSHTAQEAVEAFQESPSEPTATKHAAQVLPPTSIPHQNILPNGETVSPASLAELIGGNAAYWTQRGPVVWGYWDEGNNATFRHPGGDTILSYWAGFPEPRNADGCTIVIPETEDSTRYVMCPTGTRAEFEADGVGFHLIDYTGVFP